MSTFNLQIQSPNASLNDEMQESHDLDIASILEKFEKINWRQQRVLQLQMNGKNSVFNVVHQASDQYLKITLNAFSKSEQFEFKIESNIQLIFPQRELFGLMTRKHKESFLIKQGSLEQAQQSLQAFVNQDKQQLENIYLKSKEKSVLEAS
ncbi:hypothetical protein [Acinetobacter piscicola]|uniref:hypothetical protein n=1 Tax=Acinetobacter piscicola TaxID=2006115 RepID=UPI000B7E4A9E|nr:hypothetical protein [Acinetobacter piscicola]